MIASNGKKINVILPVPIEGVFTYSLPTFLAKGVETGSIVSCNFGTGKYIGVVQGFTDEVKPGIEIKNISGIVYPGSFIPQQTIRFWEWMAEYYLCSIGDVLKAALPPAIVPSLIPQFKAVYTPETENLKHNSRILHDLLSTKKLTVSGIARSTGIKTIKPLLNKLMEEGMVEMEYPSSYTSASKTEIYVELNPKYESEKPFKVLLDAFKNAKAKRRALLAVYENRTDGGITKNQLRALFQITSGVYNSLLKEGVLDEIHREIRFEANSDATNLAFLNPEQDKAYHHIHKQFKTLNTVLLHGVTSSGKTEVYFHLLHDFMQQGKQVLILLPEIALTNNIVARFRAAFGDMVKVYHSKTGEKERAHIWHGVRNNTVKMVLGVRSALFLPFVSLGLAIIDEEHENTYKQDDPAPRYHARDSLIMLAHHHKAKVLLGSATPSVQSYYNAAEGKFGLVQLLNRHNETPLPAIVLEDLLDCYKKRKLKKHFSYTLISTIEQSLEKGEQVILFQNRRGYAPSVECRECGYVHLCKNCNVTLTVHKTGRNLECHYCGHKEPVFDYCPECSSPKIIDRGMGTEKIEDEIRLLFPGKRVARIDTDTAGKTHNVQEVFKHFGAGNIDILVGTQMISKGLDFDNVGTVGVLNADNLLNFPNYKAAERSFQLLTQVAGRAGRKHGNGKVVIQTHQFNHPVLQAVKTHNYLLFCENELKERELFKYPPFTRLIHVNMRHPAEQTVEHFAQQLARSMHHFKGGIVLGPEKPGVDKIKNYFYRRITLKLNTGISRKPLKEWLLGLCHYLQQTPAYRQVQVLFDVDPEG